jgi:hypothetical protein
MLQRSSSVPSEPTWRRAIVHDLRRNAVGISIVIGTAVFVPLMVVVGFLLLRTN